jgi:pseudouridine synthase
MSLVRLQKYLSECGICSRRAGEKLIEAGRVRVNGLVVTELGTKIMPGRDRVTVGKKPVLPPERGILLFHKPKGVVSTLDDPQGRDTIAHFLTKHYTSYFPVGRLDMESTGLMVLTNDGEIAERLLHPRYQFKRIYECRVSGKISDKALRRLERGVRLEDGMVSAEVKVLEMGEDSTWLQLTITEGRNRVIRRVMDHLRYPVLKLKRVTYGPFRLRNIKPGEMKKLTLSEYRAVRERILEAVPEVRVTKA